MPAAELPFSAAAERNQAPILAALSELLAPDARVLELASGSGQHAAFFVGQRPGWRWWPSDGEATLLPAIKARCAGLPGVASPLQLDLLAPSPSALPAQVDAVYCANLLHIAPWSVCAALMRLVAKVLTAQGVLVLYGPWIVEGEPTVPSNLAFDADLRARNPDWGLRELAAAQREADQAGLRLTQRLAMPANNLLLIWRRAGPAVQGLASTSVAG